ncbi:pyridoxamine 5'-phosphate oxidase family protein [uncultured Pseudokineococcus sp.]|uniref:pyridoxamine 5'-phosphate oxidase family protein n=1 Tax=uncultured Pseudokineococcus sp. TaxID=1642928 RepID=UPI0026353815|nr:pyridoxamine 5'-phosphate oxidase family protein [uncultured Pseudokineococcus sp.]
MTTQEQRLEELTSEQCHELLASQVLGRLAVVEGEHPLVVPVNYAMSGGVVVLRTGEPMRRRVDHRNVAFQVDQVDPSTRSGWSVLVQGLAEEVGGEHSAEIVERTRRSGADPWAPGEREHWVRLIPHRVTGRRLTTGGDRWFADGSLYL